MQISEMATIMRLLDHTIRDSHVDDDSRSRDEIERRNDELRELCYKETGISAAELQKDQIMRYRVDSEISLN